jgi:hypothetical protein
MLQIVFLVVFGKLSTRGVYALGSMMFGLAVQKFSNIDDFFNENKIKS